MAGLGKVAKLVQKATRSVKRPVKKFMCEKVFGQPKVLTRKRPTLIDDNGNILASVTEKYVGKGATRQSYENYKLTRNATGTALGLGAAGWGTFEGINYLMSQESNTTSEESVVNDDNNDKTEIKQEETETTPETQTDTTAVQTDTTAVVQSDTTRNAPIIQTDSTQVAVNLTDSTQVVEQTDSTQVSQQTTDETQQEEEVDETEEQEEEVEEEQDIEQQNPQTNIFGGEINGITTEAHEIKKGDCLWNIAKKYLQDANPGKTITNAQILKQVKEFGRLNPEMFGENPSLDKLDLIYPNNNLKLCA